MQREIRRDTCVSTYVKSDCKEFLRSPLVAIRIDTLIISVTAQFWNKRDHILFDAVSWPIYLFGSECIFVMCNIRDSPDLILGRGRILSPKKEKEDLQWISPRRLTNMFFFNRNVTRNHSVITITKKRKKGKKTRKTYCKSWTLQVTLRPSDVLLVITQNFLSRLFHHLHLLIYYFISFDLHILFTESVISLKMRRFQYNK